MKRLVQQSCALTLLAASALLWVGCPEPTPTTEQPAQPDPVNTDTTPLVTYAIATDIGIDFVHSHGGTGERYMIETMGSGVAILDIDDDGWLDVYFVQSGAMPWVPSAGQDGRADRRNRLFHNRGTADLAFDDITDSSGAGDTGYGMGVCAGDIDNDGDVDIHVTNFGPDRLLRNDGSGKFEDVSEAAGIGDPRWGAGCAFADYDGDGWLDLFVVNYVDFTPETHQSCGVAPEFSYCHPDVYGGVADALYRNLGASRPRDALLKDVLFEEVSDAAGIANRDPRESKGLGVIWTDFDDDGDPDIYVANDSTRNFLYRNDGDGRFSEIGIDSGSAYNARGQTEAGMGIAAADIDHDGRIDLLVSHLDYETNTLYRNSGGGLYEDRTDTAGLAAPSLLSVGFGLVFLDLDHDADADLFVANGHVIDNIHLRRPTQRYAQPDLLFTNRGGRFIDVSSTAGPYFQQAHVGRGVAAGDLDNDGDLDLVISNSHQPATVLLASGAEALPSVQLRLIDRHGRDAIGARVRLTAGDTTQVDELRAGGSYLSQHQPRLHFGLGTAASVDSIDVQWPGGPTETYDGADLLVGQTTILRQSAP